MSLNLHHLRIFHLVAKEQNITRAAEKLMVSQPAVSTELKLLERALRVTLFDRFSGGVRLTAAGSELRSFAQRIFEIADAAEDAMSEMRGLRRGKLGIIAGTTIGVYLLPQAIVSFRRKFPDIQMNIEASGSSAAARRLLDGEFELALTEIHVAHPHLEAVEFCNDEMVAILPPKHSLANRKQLSAARLCREPFVVRETGSETKSLVEKALAAKGLRVAPVMSLGSTEAIKRAVYAGVGVAIVSRLTVELEMRLGMLSVARLADLTIRRPMYRIHRRGETRSAAANALLLELDRVVAARAPRSGKGKTSN